ncbi:hypothetical protein GCM10023213_17920 [Prosthecobacter algae]|uniref:Uncharacterized protein n=1 Tax=Prosthecobacter algae TaxID=1144682 RepID=A0ABP9P5X4_9BACT
MGLPGQLDAGGHFFGSAGKNYRPWTDLERSGAIETVRQNVLIGRQDTIRRKQGAEAGRVGWGDGIHPFSVAYPMDMATRQQRVYDSSLGDHQAVKAEDFLHDFHLRDAQ